MLYETAHLALLCLSRHEDDVRQAADKRRLSLGVTGYSRRELEQVLLTGEKLEIKAIGMLVIQKDVSADLATHAIGSIELYGVLRASDEVKSALESRIISRNMQ